jgi:hypothetical protein
MPAQFHTGVEVFEAQIEAVGFEFTCLVKLKTQAAEPAFSKVGIEC